MIEINVHSDIASAQEGQSPCGAWRMPSFSLQTVKDIFANNPNESEFQFNYHCNGGSVSEGFAIYDFIRTSGKTIHSNIEGDCHSMAITLMLAGAKENRRCNPNASALIHEVRGGAYGTADEMREQAEYMDTQTEKMLNIYADRTADRATLENLLKEESPHKRRTQTIWIHFKKINPYTTNQMAKKNKRRARSSSEQSRGASFLGIKNFLTGKTDAPKTFDFKTAEGAVLFYCKP